MTKVLYLVGDLLFHFVTKNAQKGIPYVGPLLCSSSGLSDVLNSHWAPTEGK